MEVQINVSQAGGKQISQESGYSGRIWRGFTDGETTWKPFRIPWNAMTSPEFTDSNMSFDLGKYAEGIGMTGWNWVKKQSIWVAYDFDSIIGHSGNKVMTGDELNELRNKVQSIPWITTRHSTGGVGLHLYVFLNNVKTENHTEHAAVARSVLGRISAETGLDLQAQVDTCGGNMWVWHTKKQDTNGLSLIKQGTKLDKIPVNWKDHLDVITGKRRKNLPGYIESEDMDIFEQLCAQRPKIKLDKNHKQLLAYLKDSKAQWWWDSDHWMLVCHTNDLAKAHKALGFRGIFNTQSTGKDDGDHNCFCYPLTKPLGAWVVRRYSKGAGETDSWNQDGKGWTYCHLNKHASIEEAAHVNNGVEDEKGFFHFTCVSDALKAAKLLGSEFEIDIPDDRPMSFKRHKDGRLIIHTEAQDADSVKGWRKDKSNWVKIVNADIEINADLEVQEYANMVRHLLTNSIDAGWCYQVEVGWVSESLKNIQLALASLGLTTPEISKVIGDAVNLPWLLVNEPFQPEYMGDRKWNRDGAQLAFTPQLEGPFVHPTWDKILNHVGTGLNLVVSEDDWCKKVGIQTGGDYLRVWVASLFQSPKKKLPYLFFYSADQKTGKTTFHEMLGLLMTKGYGDASAALTSTSGFNAELLNAILCRIEETDLQQNKLAKNRIKNWITAKEMSYHEKGKTPYLVTNYTHYVQCGNIVTECPVFDGDTRITICEVPLLSAGKLIPQEELEERCIKEAPAFMATLLGLEIPASKDPRLNLPVMDTGIKQQAQQDNRSTIDTFLNDVIKEVPGSMILYSDLWNKFQGWVDPNESWTQIKFGKRLPTKFPKGRVMESGAKFFIGNMAWVTDKETKPGNKLRLQGGCLI